MTNPNLPSKQFLIRGAIATGLLAVILIVQTNWFHGLFHKKTVSDVGQPQRASDIIGRDSNQNGIADWEERLWGLDPTVLYTDGRPNAQIIKEKRDALGIKTINDTQLSQSDSIAQKLFILSASIGQENGVSDDALNGAAKAVGDTVQVQQISNHYTLNALTRVATTIPSIKTYYQAMSTVSTKLTNDNVDIDALVEALQTGDFSGLSALDATKQEYRALAEKIRTISVPVGLAQDHLNIMNGVYGIADSFDLIQMIQNDGFQGLAGLAAYKRYNELLQNALFEEHKYFISYGIL